MASPKSMQLWYILLALSILFTASAAPTPSAELVPEPVTEPVTEPGYVSGPKERGTLTLFWSCVATFILCVWTAVHPDVVPVNGPRAANFYKFFLMTWAVVIPELVVCMAVEQYRRACKIRDKWNKAFSEDSETQSWLGLTGAFFVVMGGYVVETGRATELQAQLTKSHSAASKRQFLESEPPLVTTIGPQGFEELLDSGKIQGWIRDGTLGKHHFDQTLIEDKANANTISKLIVTAQICWMLVQSAGRKISGLPVTLLEAHVLIQILYSVVAFCCWWAKPLDINKPIRLPLGPDDLGHDTTQPTRKHERDLPFYTEYQEHGGWFYMFYRAAYDVLKYLCRKIEFWASILAIANGALHATVWNSHFPTRVETIMWRFSSIGLGAFPSMVYFIMMWNTGFDRLFITIWYQMRFETGSRIRMSGRNLVLAWNVYRESVNGEGMSEGMAAMIPKWLRFVLLGICTVCMALYVACILFLTAEAFISMRSLPHGAYRQPSWSGVFPHV